MPDSKYPAQPANFLTDQFINASEGRLYFAIMHGKNVMGPYADKLNYEERWQVLHYIRGLQAKSKNLVYSEAGNTFNNNRPARGQATGAARQTVVVQDSLAGSQQTPAPSSRPAKQPGLNN